MQSKSTFMLQLLTLQNCLFVCFFFQTHVLVCKFHTSAWNIHSQCMKKIYIITHTEQENMAHVAMCFNEWFTNCEHDCDYNIYAKINIAILYQARMCIELATTKSVWRQAWVLMGPNSNWSRKWWIQRTRKWNTVRIEMLIHQATRSMKLQR